MEQAATEPKTSGTTVSVDVESLDSATDEQLESLLKGESEAETEVVEQPAGQPEGAQEETPPEESKNEDSTTEEAGVEATKQTAPQPTSEERLSKIQRQLDGLELLVQRRTSEISELKRRLLEEAAPIKKRLEEGSHDNTYQALKDAEALKDKEAQIEQLDGATDELQKTVQAQRIVASFVKPDDTNIDEMAGCLAQDGIPTQAVEHFKRNPFVMAQPETIVQLAKRAKAERLLRQVYDVAKKLNDENKRLRDQPKAVLNGVQKALKSSPTITAASGSASSSSLSTSDIEEMNDAELEEFLKTAKR